MSLKCFYTSHWSSPTYLKLALSSQNSMFCYSCQCYHLKDNNSEKSHGGQLILAQYCGQATLKFGSWTWWAVEAPLFDGSRGGNCTTREQNREWILTGNVKFKLSSSAKRFRSECKSILKPFTLAELGKKVLGLREPQFLLLQSCLDRKNKWSGSFTEHF